MRPGAILFDLDGVLVDSMDSWLACLNAALKAFHYDEVSKEEFIEIYWGHDLNDNIERMGLTEEVGRFCNNKYSEYLHVVKIYPDVRDTLQKLSSYKKGIITNTPGDCAFQILKKFDIEQYFETVITSDEVVKAKPNPEIVLKACKVLCVEPENVVLIGDTDSDVKAGKDAGCTVVGINIPADYTIKRLSDLTKLILL